MTNSAAEPARLRVESSGSTKKQVRRQKPRTGSLHPASRFFLAKPGASGESPELDREILDSDHDPEGRANFEAVKSGVTVYEVIEWRPVYNFSENGASIGKEAVGRKRA